MRLSAQPFDAVLTDVVMPGMDGMAVLRRAHEIVPGIPVVLVTVNGGSDTETRALRLGAAGYLVKPFSFPDLASTVERVVGVAPAA